MASVASEPLRWLADALTEGGDEAALLTTTSAAQWRKTSATGGAGRRWSQGLESVRLWVLALERRVQGEVWVVVTTPPWLPSLFVWTKPLHHRPVVVLVHDLLPEVLAARFGGLAAHPAVKGALWRLWGATLARATGVVWIGARMAAEARARIPNLPANIAIETGAPVAFPDARRVEGPAQVAYIGHLGHMHDWQTLAEGLRLWLEADPRSLLTVAATGPGVGRLRAALADERVQWRGALGESEWTQALTRADVALISLREEAALASFPSKVFSAMRAGCAVVAVAPSRSDLASLVEDSGCGLVAAPGDPAALRDHLLALTTDALRLRACQARALRAAQTTYAISTLARRWRGFLQALAPKGAL